MQGGAVDQWKAAGIAGVERGGQGQGHVGGHHALLGIAAEGHEGGHRITHLQARHAGPDLGHHTGHFRTRREGRVELHLVLAGDLQRVWEVHAGTRHLHAHLTRAQRSGRDLLQLQQLGLAEGGADDGFHVGLGWGQRANMLADPRPKPNG